MLHIADMCKDISMTQEELEFLIQKILRFVGSSVGRYHNNNVLKWLVSEGLQYILKGTKVVNSYSSILTLNS